MDLKSHHFATFNEIIHQGHINGPIFAVLGFELGAYTLSHPTSLFM
jgi:hypothetical protein